MPAQNKALNVHALTPTFPANVVNATIFRNWYDVRFIRDNTIDQLLPAYTSTMNNYLLVRWEWWNSSWGSGWVWCMSISCQNVPVASVVSVVFHETHVVPGGGMFDWHAPHAGMSLRHQTACVPSRALTTQRLLPWLPCCLHRASLADCTAAGN